LEKRLTSKTAAFKQESLIRQEALQPYLRRYRWVMLALVTLLYALFGMVRYSLSPLVTPVIRDLGISFSQMGVILGSWQLTYIAAAAVGGSIMDRWGVRRSLLVGILIIGLSEVLRYFAGGFTTMFLFVAIFGLGGPMISIGCPKTISEWFRGKERATAVGIYTMGSSLGGLLAYTTANSVVMPFTGYSWRLAFVVFGIPAFVAAFIWWFTARDVKSSGPKESVNVLKVFTGVMRIRNVQLVLAMGVLNFAITHGLTNWLPKILETGGLPPVMASFQSSITLIVGIPAVLLIPRFTPFRLRGRIIALLSAVVAVSSLVIVMTSGISLVTGLVLYGLTNISIVPLLMLILMDTPEVGTKYMGSVGGLFFCVAEIGGFLGPTLIGAIRDATGTFLAGAILIAALSLVVGTMALVLKIKRA
jgi:CP family cyanate transporter-like MFS transporter